MAQKPKPTYSELHDELEAIIDTLQRDDTDVDQALEKYKRGLELINGLQQRLDTAANEVRELQAE